MKALRTLFGLLLLSSILAGPRLLAEDAPVPSRHAESAAAGALDRARAIQAELHATIVAVRPSVVAIEIEGKGPGGKALEGEGSGVVVDPSGLVLTNYHVAGWADRIRVVFAGGRRYPAKVRGKDEEGDLALLEVRGEGPFPAATFGDSARLRTGQWVLAMGNPKMVSTDGQATVTWGTITGLHVIGGGVAGEGLFYGDAIQTDAEINPGNSGGPLFDLSGRLVGINGRIATRDRIATGAVNASVGYAIPVDQIRRFLPLLVKGEEVRHGFLGVRVAGREEGSGVEILTVLPASPAERAGLRPGDRLLAVDGVRAESPTRLTNLVSSRPAGARVALRIRRDGAERIEVAVLGARPEVAR